MFSLFAVKNLSPAQVKAGLDAGEIVLVDVRESDEHNAERIGFRSMSPYRALRSLII